MLETIATYDAVAPGYADRWFNLRLADEMARFAQRLGAGVRVLDVGCGSGRDTAWLAEQGFRAVGVDLSSGMLEQALAHDVAAPLIQADMAHLPFRRGSFKGLWVCASLLHIPKEQAGDVLRELARVVYPGHIYLAVKRGEGSEWVVNEEGRRFFAYYHPAEIQLLMERSGFEVLSCWENPDSTGRPHPWISVLAWNRMQTPKTGTCAILLSQAGEVLLTRRADNGQWCLPGGHLDFGETVEQCVVREVYEETGLLVQIERLVGVYSHPIPPGQGLPSPRHYVILSFLCRATGGALHLSDETSEVRYFPPEALPDGLWTWQRDRIADALAGQSTPFIR